MRRIVWVLLASAIATATLVRPASACTCVARGAPCQGLWASNGTPADVFEATVASLEETTLTAADAGAATYLVGTKRITAHLTDVRGRLGRTTTTVFTSSDTCAFPFQVGRRYLIHTSITPTGASVSLCSFSADIASAAPTLAFLDSLAREGPGATVSGQVRLRLGLLAHDSRNRAIDGIRVTLSGAVTRSVVTGADGAFAFDALQPGEYFLRAAEDESRALVPIPSSSFTFAHAHACRTETLEMAFTSLVDGTLRDLKGTPLPGMAVELRNADLTGRPMYVRRSDEERKRPAPLAPADSIKDLTSASGRFAFRGAPPGRYVIGVNLDASAEDGPLAPSYLTGRDGQRVVVTLAIGEHRTVGPLAARTRDCHLQAPSSRPTGRRSPTPRSAPRRSAGTPGCRSPSTGRRTAKAGSRCCWRPASATASRPSIAHTIAFGWKPRPATPPCAWSLHPTRSAARRRRASRQWHLCQVPPGVTNSAGYLMLHLDGNLREFVYWRGPPARRRASCYLS
ncbi:MAG: carboxypeptidase-like regulatory domain-containing protein [Vicinamibacterales bacterium]